MNGLRIKQLQQLAALELLLKTKSNRSERAIISHQIHILKDRLSFFKTKSVDNITQTEHVTRAYYRNTKSNNYKALIH